MFKIPFIAAFVLSLITWAVDYALWPSDSPSPGSVLVVLMFWFGMSVLLQWLLSRNRPKDDKDK